MRAWCVPISASLALLATSGLAQERILDFHSDVRLSRDGSAVVTETIRVRAEGHLIKRGIYRDFPTEYRDRLGNRYRVDFEVLSTLRDRAPEPHFMETRSNGVRTYLGHRDVLLPPGDHEYEIRYRTDHQVGFFAAHDELYWNVTGNGWAFPIDRASARVTLPAPIERGQVTMEGYLGEPGSTERSLVATVEAGGTARIVSARVLQPGEGLTLAMTWPKGLVEAPGRLDRLWRLLDDNAGLLVALSCLLGNLAYFAVVWHAHGRDPDAGVIFPHYQPPDLVSPASARHVSRMGYDRKTFSAAIINLAVKGYLDITEAGDEYTVRRIDHDPAQARETRSSGARPALSPGERVVLERLFATGKSLALAQRNHRALTAAMAAHRRALERDHYAIYFRTNAVYLTPAAVMLLVAAVGVVVLEAVTPVTVAILVLGGLMVWLFAHLLKAPTRIGAKLRDRIEGFRLYLDVAEKDELNLVNPPRKTPALFEAYLPYALALDVEQHWAEKFNRVLERVSEETGGAYRPAWYHGRWDPRSCDAGFGAMAAGMTDAVESAIASASTAPGTTSGTGGGGSSGGGGGGGGGGGW